MCDPAGVHITRIFVNYSRQTPSPIRSTGTVPVCTSTPIINVGLPKPLPKPSPKQQMALLAKEILAQQRCSETFTQKPESPQQPEQFVFISKESGQHIDFKTGDGLGKLNNINTGTVVTKKKKQRETLAIVPPATSARLYFKSNLIFYLSFFSLLKVHQNQVMMEII
jgi:hypothetical protein